MTSNSTLAPPPVRRLFGGVMYKGPFIYGIVLALDLLALSHALSAIVKTRARRLPLPWYFVIVAAIIVAHVLDATLAAVSWTPEAVGPGFMLIAPGFLSANVVGVVFGWLNNAGFTALNFIRLRAFTKPDYPWLTWLMTCLVAVSCLACTANNIMYIICYIRNSTLAPELAVADTVYGYWSIFDCAVNTSSSIGFAAVMQIMFPIGEAVRPGLKALLRRAQAILAVECVVFIAVNGTVLAAPYLDPILLVPYTVEDTPRDYERSTLIFWLYRSKSAARTQSPSTSNQFIAVSRAPTSKFMQTASTQDVPRAKERHVEYILLAEFDIEKGSSLAWEYPEDTGTRKETLAELMLPDGAHNRTDDWTMFFLNQSHVPSSNATEVVDSAQGTTGPDSQLAKQGKPLLFCLNYIGTKRDSNVKRGAIMKAMAVCSKHQFVHVFKPPVLLALSMYLEKPSLSVLAYLYNAINSMDLTALPRLSTAERQILRNADMWATEVLEHKLQGEQPPEGMNLAPLPAASQTVETSTIGSASIKSVERARKTSSWPGQAASPQLNAGKAARIKDWHYYEAAIPWEDKNNKNITLKARIPLIYIGAPEEVGEFDVRKLVTTFSALPAHSFPPPMIPELHTSGPQTPSVMLLLNALILQKRVLFIGYNRPSKEVAEFVLAACSIASGNGAVLRGYTERAFPYTCLANVDDILACEGYIAGVTNPFFEQKTQWWDVCCNIVSGKVTVSPNYRPSLTPVSADSVQQQNGGDSSQPTLGSMGDMLNSGSSTSSKKNARKSRFMGSFTERWLSSGTPLDASQTLSGKGDSRNALNDSNADPPHSSSSSSSSPWMIQPKELHIVLPPMSSVPPPRSHSLGARSTAFKSESNIARSTTTGAPGTAGLNYCVMPPRSPRKSETAISHAIPLRRSPSFSNKKDKTYDMEFMAEARLSRQRALMIQQHIHNHASDLFIRQLFQEYIGRFSRIAATYELDCHGDTFIGYKYPSVVHVNGRREMLSFGPVWPDENARRRDMELMVPLIEAWRGSTSYRYFVTDFQQQLQRSRFGDIDIVHQVLLLRSSHLIPTSQLLTVYHGLIECVCNDDLMTEFLSALPLNRGGLLPVANGLLHPDHAVRGACAQFMTAVRYNAIGAVYMRRLPHFLRKAYEFLTKSAL
ncbi:hypothetical protein RI367_001046 [Sorochytrium milnesiophthora]